MVICVRRIGDDVKIIRLFVRFLVPIPYKYNSPDLSDRIRFQMKPFIIQRGCAAIRRYVYASARHIIFNAVKRTLDMVILNPSFL